MYIKGLVNTKDQSNACMCEMMSKGLKEALTVLIVTHATLSKGSKEALTILIVTHVTHVERVESGVCGLYTQYRYIQCYVERVKRLCYVETKGQTHFCS